MHVRGAAPDGHDRAEVREFLRWYAAYQAPDGTDAVLHRPRAAPTRSPEHDSDGEFDLRASPSTTATRATSAFVHELWPNVVPRGRAHLAALRGQRMTDAYRAPEQARVLRPAARVDQPRGLLGASGALVLGRLLRAARPEGRGGAGAASSATTSARRATRRSATSSAPTLYASIDRGDGAARHRLHARIGRARRLRSDVDGDRARARRRAGEPAGGAARSAPSIATGARSSSAGDGHVELGRLHALRAAQRRGARTARPARPRATALLDWLIGGQRPAAWNEWAEVVWRDPQRAAVHRRHAAHLGRGRLRAARCATCSPTSARRDQALVVAAGIDPAWVTAEPGVTVRRLPTHWGILNFTLRASGRDACACGCRGSGGSAGQDRAGIAARPAHRGGQGERADGGAPRPDAGADRDRTGRHRAVVQAAVRRRGLSRVEPRIRHREGRAPLPVAVEVRCTHWPEARLFHYRTKHGAEVDFVLEIGRGEQPHAPNL